MAPVAVLIGFHGQADASTVLYQNGTFASPPNAHSIGVGRVVSDSFSLGQTVEISGFTFSMTSDYANPDVSWAISTGHSAGGTVIASGSGNVSGQYVGNTYWGAKFYLVEIDFQPVQVESGSYWLSLYGVPLIIGVGYPGWAWAAGTPTSSAYVDGSSNDDSHYFQIRGSQVPEPSPWLIAGGMLLAGCFPRRRPQ